MNILVTAGATREPIDPVRFISNYSTGVLGCELARQAQKREHRVILISACLAQAKPQGLRSVDVQTARQMAGALKAKFNWCDCLIMTAAVGDFRAKDAAKKKIKRGRRKKLVLALRQNPDILGNLGRRKGKKILVGVALETENLKRNTQYKLKAKNLDVIVATQIKTNSYPFGPVRMDALIMDKTGRWQQLRRVSKRVLSRILLDSIERIVL